MNNGKIRIYELSKELNLENKDIKDICEQLNITVKSHSSTITDSQAERVRAAAVKYTPEKAAIKTQKNLKNKGKRKTQILAIHHKKNSADSKAQREVAATPTLAGPPKLPTAPSTSQKTTSTSSPKTLAQPPKVATKPSSFTSGSAEASATIQTEQTTKEPKQQLVAPPARPQLNKPSAKQSHSANRPGRAVPTSDPDLGKPSQPSKKSSNAQRAKSLEVTAKEESAEKTTIAPPPTTENTNSSPTT